MSLPIVLRAAAQDEADQAAQWYERKARAWGSISLPSCSECSLSSRPIPTVTRSPPVILARLPSRFPYCVYYRVGRNRIAVTAVFHTVAIRRSGSPGRSSLRGTNK